MANQLVSILLLSILSMVNPTLLAAVTVMLLLPNPRRLLAGYLLGAYLTSITLGLIIVFAVPQSSTESTSKHHISPVMDLVVAGLLWTLVWVLQTGRDQPFSERRRVRKEAKLEARRRAGKPTESLPLRLLGKGDPRVTFLVGAALSFPGVSYLDALDHMRRLHTAGAVLVLLVIFFCLMQQMFLELPLLGYIFAPDSTRERVTGFRSWMARSGRSAASGACALLGLLLVIRGVIGLT